MGAVPTRTNIYREVYKFMRKTVKKLTAVGLTLTSVMGLVACGITMLQQKTKQQ